MPWESCEECDGNGWVYVLCWECRSGETFRAGRRCGRCNEEPDTETCDTCGGEGELFILGDDGEPEVFGSYDDGCTCDKPDYGGIDCCPYHGEPT